MMRNLQLSLNQTQKVRLQSALEKLESLSSKSNANSTVTVADSIPIYEEGILKGHGTSERKGELVATVCGVVERINKLIYVRGLRSRYKPETGDIVIGRVIEVAQKRWKLEINFTQDATLMLSSMSLPDGIQRRRTAVDELNMRSIFTENDLVCAEVRSSQNDGSLQLQARNQKYGKLKKGQLLTVDPYLVKRRKQHFHHLEEYGIDLILGSNGFIWVGKHVEARDKTVVDEANDSEQQIGNSDRNFVDLDEQDGTFSHLETRQNICRIANAVRVLSALGFSITMEVIMETVNLSNTMNLDIHEMLGSEFYVLVAESEAERRIISTKRKRFFNIIGFGNMKIGSYVGIRKSNFLLVHTELPAFAFCKSQLISSSTIRITSNDVKNSRLISKFQCSVADRTFASSSVDASASKPKTGRSGWKQGSSSSLYSRPSLLEMKNERMANRAKVYDFLRGIGIVPDELDGLELPVTAEVMRERVDFLHSLGLTIDDINNYPLVLGCSVKKNMIPVLDYLGKLGVRKSTFTEFLRRYPQVLHASVVVDLAPVVKYLQGLDIKVNDIPQVLERYPEVLGFKLEGTMSTSVAYLVGIGVARREIGGVLTRYPEILGMRVGRVIKPFVEYLEDLGVPRLAMAKLIEKRPHILGFGLKERVKPNVESLLEFNVRREVLPSVVAQYPEIIGMDLKPKLIGQQYLLKSIIDIGLEDFGSIIEKMPHVVSVTNSAITKHVDFLKDCGFPLEQVRKMVVGCPQVLALNVDVMKLSFDYFQREMQRPLDDLVAFPAFFTYGLESTIKPRHRMIAKKGLKCSLSWLLNCTDEKFEERMDYDTIDMEEMETMPSFDMNTLMEPRSEDESGSEYEEDSDDEYV